MRRHLAENEVGKQRRTTDAHDRRRPERDGACDLNACRCLLRPATDSLRMSESACLRDQIPFGGTQMLCRLFPWPLAGSRSALRLKSIVCRQL